MKQMLRKLCLLLLWTLPAFDAGAADVYVYLIGGQSNATGQGRVSNLPASFRLAESVEFFYSRFLNRGEGSGKWGPLRPASETLDKFGVELSLGTALQRYYPQRRIALVKHALSGSNLFRQWNPGNRPGEKRGAEFTKWLDTVTAALDSLRSRGDRPIICAMVWQQGEADARFDAGDENSRRYGENLKNFIAEVRRVLQVPDLLFVYGEVMPMAAERFSRRDWVRQAQRDVAEGSGSPLSVEGAVLVEGDDLQMLCADYRSPQPSDDVHLGTFGLLTLGERFAKVISERGR